MMGNRGFHHLHEPFRSHDSVQLDKTYIDGPISFLNPTRAHVKHTTLVRSSFDNEQQAAASPNSPDVRKHHPDIEIKWRSRDNRKGRHALLVEPRALVAADQVVPQPTSTFPGILRGITRMFTQCPYWDVSYFVATIFTLGSVVWVINAFFAYLPLAQPQTEFDTEILYGGGITAFIGATIFEIGSVLLMFEAVNENRTGCFGWALERLVEGNREKAAKLWICPDKDGCRHHHTNKRNLFGRGDGENRRRHMQRLLLMYINCSQPLRVFPHNHFLRIVEWLQGRSAPTAKVRQGPRSHLGVVSLGPRVEITLPP